MEKSNVKPADSVTKNTSEDYITIDFRGLTLPWAIVLSTVILTLGVSTALYFGLKARPVTTTGTDVTETPEPTPVVLTQTEFDAVAAVLANHPFKGNKDAPIVIMEFGDYSCTFCNKFFAETEPSLFNDYVSTGKVAFYYNDYPRNASVADAQYFSICVAKTYGNEKFFAYHDEMYKNLATYYATSAFDTAKLKTFLSANGMDYDKLKTCADGADVRAQLVANGELLNKLGQASTPMFFVAKNNNGKLTNGVMIEGAQPYAVFKQVLDNLLE